MSVFSTAAVFSSNMVLQRNKNVNVFGYGEDGKKVTVTIFGKDYSSVIENGRWNVVIPPMSAGTGYEMTVTCENETKKFVNIAVGEVWLAGGQSNMELELQNCKDGKKYLETDIKPDVRYYYTQKNCYMDEKFFADEKNTGWNEFSEENAKCWSAVGYFFAKELSEKLGVTVGVIGCNWGGTSASHWMSREKLLEDCDNRLYMDEYDRAIAGKSEEELDKEYFDYVEYDKKWFEKSQVFYAEHPDGSWEECCEFCGKNLYPGPLCPRNPFHATALYESMIKRVAPYTLAGFIYYQGESDDHRPNAYYKLMRALIEQWRSDWNDDELPFLLVQLPMHRYKADPDFKNWPLIREAQMKIYNTVKNTGIAVITDCGEWSEIHPKDKVPVGHRLFLQAMKHVYGDDKCDAFGPIFKDTRYEGEKLRLLFDYNENGFRVNGEGGGFEIAGADKKYIAAKFSINPDNSITVWADEIKAPKYARYLWTNYTDVTIFGVNGIPLAPFRTSVEDGSKVEK